MNAYQFAAAWIIGQAVPFVAGLVFLKYTGKKGQ